MQTHFNIFGDSVELLVLSRQTNGAFSIGRQTSKPGGGPPPHFHQNEDEVFSVVTGRFEIFNGETGQRSRRTASSSLLAEKFTAFETAETSMELSNSLAPAPLSTSSSKVFPATSCRKT
jgi:hypothetical protein